MATTEVDMITSFCLCIYTLQMSSSDSRGYTAIFFHGKNMGMQVAQKLLEANLHAIQQKLQALVDKNFATANKQQFGMIISFDNT